MIFLMRLISPLSLRRVLLWVCGCVLAGGLQGQTIVWNGTAGDWLTPGNWSNGVPTGASIVMITTGGPVTLAGNGAAGSLYLYGAGSLTLTAGTLTSGEAWLGDGGSMTVSGGAWFNSGSLNFDENVGVLTVSGGGAAQVGSIDFGSKSTGTINLNGSNGSRGVLSMGALYAKNGVSDFGSGYLNFDGGILRATENSDFFVNSVGHGKVTFLAGGAFIDSNGHEIKIAESLEGVGGLTKQGAGSLTLAALNTFTGDTVIEAGTLILGHADALRSSTYRSAAGGGSLSFGSHSAVSLGGLAGDANIDLGNVALSVGRNGADTTYSGSLSGEGGSLIKTGAGDLTLTGSNTHSRTTVDFGTLTLGSAGALGTTGTISFEFGRLRFTAANTLDYSGRFATSEGQRYEIDTNGQNVTFASGLTSNGSILEKFGAGTLTLTGNNTLVSHMTIRAGTLAIAGAGTLGTYRVEVRGGTLDLGGQQRSAGSLLLENGAVENGVLTGTSYEVQSGTVNASLAGAGIGLAKTTGGTVTLSGANTFSGNTTITAGTLNLSHSLALQNSTLTYSVAGGVLNFGALTTVALGGLSGEKDLAFPGVTLAVGGNGNSTSYGGVLSGAGAILTKQGVGTLNLSGANAYTGGTNLEGGVLQLGSAGALGTSGSISFDGGALRFSAANLNDYSSRFSTAAGQLYRIDTGGFDVSLASALTSSGGSLSKLGGGALTLTGANTYTGGTNFAAGVVSVAENANLGAAAGALNFSGGTLRSTADVSMFRPTTLNAGGGTFDVATGTLTQRGVISGAGDLTKVGSGTLELRGSNTYSGWTFIKSGTLAVSAGGRISPNFVVVGQDAGDNGSLLLTSGEITSVAGDIGARGGATGNATVTGGNWTNSWLLNVGNAGTGTLTVSDYGAVSAPTVYLSKAPGVAGTLNLVGTAVSRGMLTTGQVRKDGGNGTINFDGGVLRAAGIQSDFLSGFEAGNVQILGGGAFIDTNGQGIGISSVLSGIGGLTRQGIGTLTLSGINTYAGGTTINSFGTLVIADNANLGAAAGELNLDGGTLRTTANIAINRETVLRVGGGIFDVSSDTLTQLGRIGGPGDLTKQGDGTLLLTGPNYYSGATRISRGTLALGAGVALDYASGIVLEGAAVFDVAASGFTLGAGKTLSGSGYVRGALTNAGTISTAAGQTLTFGGAVSNTGTVSVGGTVKLNEGGSSSGALTLLGGALELGGSSFSVSNASTGISGAGSIRFGGESANLDFSASGMSAAGIDLIFAAGTTTFDFGVRTALLAAKSLTFAGGGLLLQGAGLTHEYTGSLTLRNFEFSPDHETTVVAGGTFVWNGGVVRSILNLENGIAPTTVILADTPTGTNEIQGTLVNRSAGLEFQGRSGGAMEGTGTLRNAGTLSINLSEVGPLGFVGSSDWAVKIENTGTASLQGTTGNSTSPTYFVGNGGGFTGLVTNSGSLTISGDVRVANLTQTAGTTTLAAASRIVGLWDIQGGTLNALNGVYFAGGILNSGTLNFGGNAFVENSIINRTGGIVRVTGSLVTSNTLLPWNEGTVILDGATASLINVGVGRSFGLMPAASSMDLGSIAAGTLELRNGASVFFTNGIGGAANLIVGNASTVHLTGGTFNGPGALSVLSGGVVNNNGGATWGARPITNAGTFNMTGAVNVANGTALTFDNLAGGVVNITGNFNAGAGGSSAALTNAADGTIRKVSGSPGFFDLIYGNGAVVNHGLVEVQAGTGLMALKNLTNDGTLRAAAGTELWVDGGSLLAGTILDGAGTFRFRENTTTIGAGLTLSAKDLWIEGGTLTGAGAITVRSGDVLRFSHGTLNGTGGLSILSGGVMNNNGGTWGARPITNAGTFNVTGAVNVANGTALTFDNLAGGVVNITGNFNAGAGGSGLALTNATGGTIRKVSGSPGFFDLIYGNGTVVNHGLVEVQAGTGLMAMKNLTNDGTLRAAAGTELWIDGGSLLAGTILDGAGTFRFRENTTTLGAGFVMSAKDLWIEGGTLTGAGAITVRSGDVLRFSHGTLNGTGGLSILSGGVVNNGGGVWGARPITNAGTFNVNGAVNVANGTALTFDNLAGGVVNITSNFNASAGGSGLTLTNAAGGTIRKVSGSPGFFDLIYGNGAVVNHGLVEVQAGTGLMAMKNLTNDGTLRAAAGTELWIDGGSLLAGTILDGAGTFRFRENTTTIGAGFVMSAKDLWIEGGTLTGAGAITVRSGDVLRFSHGTLNGTGGLSILSGGVVNNGGAAWGARPVTNAGTFNVTGAVNVANGTALTFDNLAGGVVNITSNFNASAGGSSLALTNAAGGTVSKVSGSPGFFDLIYGNGTVVNHGLVEVQAGTGLMALKNLTNDGTLRAVAGTEMFISSGTLLPGTVLDGAGTFRFRENTTTIGAGLALSAKDLWIESGTVTGPGTITVRSGDVLRFTDGTLAGTGGLAILSGGVVNNTGGGTWAARPVTNAGTFNATGAVNLTNGTALTFDNLAGGVVNLTGNSQFLNAGGPGQSASLTNAAGATITKSGNTTEYELIYSNGSIVNHGLIEQRSNSGWLRLNNLTNDGTLRAVAGTELFISSGTLLPGTVLDGAGTFRFQQNTTTIGAGLALSAKNLWIESGTVTGPGAITVRSGDVMRFTSGALNGTGGLSILSGGVLTNNGGGVWGARPVTNAGTFNVTGAVNLTNGTALTFDNQAGGVVELNNSYQFLNAGGPGQWVPAPI